MDDTFSKVIMFTKPKRKVDRVFIHCSDSDHPHHDTVKVIEDWHRERWPKSCEHYCGYHYFITKTGVVMPSRPLEKNPIAQGGHNSQTIAICVSGKKQFTDEQMHTLEQLCWTIFAEYFGRVSFHGHCEVSNKTCPVFDYRKVLDLDDLGRLGGSGEHLPTLKQGSRGAAVVHLQKIFEITPDGYFGDKTTAFIKGFQFALGLIVDGIVGRKTWEKIERMIY